MFLGITPLRISFAGGGTDIPEYFEEYGGKVVASCINRFVYVITYQRHDDALQVFSSDLSVHNMPTSFDKIEASYGNEIVISVVKHLKFKEGSNFLLCSDVLPGSGLGASGALTVNLVNTINSLKGEKQSSEQIAEVAYHIGRNILKWPIGKQDEYSTAHGGLNYITFTKEKVKVNPVEITKSSLLELQNNLLLFFLKKPRKSSTILTKQIENIKMKKKDTINSLHQSQILAEEVYHAMNSNDITRIGELLHQGWQNKKKFASGVSNEFVDKIYDVALKHGSIGGKLTGAGGGGHLLLYCDIPKQRDLITKMESFGIKLVEFGLHMKGPKLINLYDFVKD